MPHVKAILSNFFERNLFERIIVYIFMSELLVKIIFELIIGQWSFIQSQNKQWIFYIFLALDYVLSVKKVTNIRVSVNPTSLLAFVFFIMVVHGLFIGLMLGNAPFVILNDTIPVLMIGLNILRMQSVAEYKPPDLRFLLYFCSYITLGTAFFGYVAALIGQQSGPSIPAEAIYLPLFFAALFTVKPFPKWILGLVVVMIAVTSDDLNRTTMAFLAIVMFGYVLFDMVKNPAKGVITLVVLLSVLAVAVHVVPEDSKTYRRVIGLTEIDLSKKTGSIGERQEEWRAIVKKEYEKGKTVEMFGLGFGGVYEVARTHEFLKNYGHAHYSWAWFKLRFGDVGFVYLLIFAVTLLYNGFIWSVRCMQGNVEGLFVVFLCLISLLYCVTYVNAVLLMMGIQFIYYRPDGFVQNAVSK
tara:strand:+ start:25464 stop:26699 length:1236 start_codon:yes stop_codon:yes gene_type:complete